ncbi:MAG: hypothetical protein P1U74_03115 [Legionellaceae bacterium]|nr:hypothetical protein [Legionellaceae bacterium]
MTKITSSCSRSNDVSKNIKVNCVSGLFTGFCISTAFHPLDRALHRSIINHRPILRMINFDSPFQCITQSVFQKTVLGGVYFFLQAEIKNQFEYIIPENLSNGGVVKQCGTGLVAGGISSVINNPLSAIKYYAWGDGKMSYLKTASIMWLNGGFKPFVRGLGPSIMRDGVQACTYEVVRFWLYNCFIIRELQIQDKYSYFLSNILAAAVGSIASAPLNYVRSQQFATHPDERTKGVVDSLAEIITDSKIKSVGLYSRASFFSRHCKIGPGVALAATRVALGQSLFDFSKEQLLSKI